MTVLSALPVLLVIGLFVGFFGVFAAVVPSPPQYQRHLNRAEIAGDPAATAEETTEQVEQPREDGLADSADSPWTTAERADEPPPLAVFLVIIMMFGFYALLFLGMILCWAWQLWFTTRMMFVYPLLADRGLGVAEAIRRSWSETRVRFWELLLLNLVAQIISAVGVYLMYVGMLFTFPIGLTILASVYEERFSPSSGADGDKPPRDK